MVKGINPLKVVLPEEISGLSHGKIELVFAYVSCNGKMAIWDGRLMLH